jgi:HAD superfamily hydrolase (TIGR01509 family)
MVQAVLFDLDGTLVDSERQYGEALARALRTGAGLDIDQADRDFVIGHSWVAIHAHLAAKYPEFTWPRDELIAATAAAGRALFAEHGAHELPGACAAVARFADKKRALVTGSSRVEAGHMLDLLGVAACFPVRFCAEDVPRSKPAPDGYLMACERLGVEPRHAVVVEDSAAGVAAGRAAGCIVIAVRAGNFANHDQSAAHRIIDSLEELTTELVGEVAALASSGYGDAPA